jgi:hypothetical protein
MSASTTGLTTTYDAAGNIIQTVAANEGLANNAAVSPLTSTAVQPNVAPTGVSNLPLNAKTAPISSLQIGAGTGSYLSVISNPA